MNEGGHKNNAPFPNNNEKKKEIYWLFKLYKIMMKNSIMNSGTEFNLKKWFSSNQDKFYHKKYIKNDHNLANIYNINHY